MDKLGCSSIFILCIFTTFLFTVGDGDQQNLEGHKRILYFPKRLRSMFSFPKTTSTSYWEKVKTLINLAHAYFFPPNIESVSQITNTILYSLPKFMSDLFEICKMIKN